MRPIRRVIVHHTASAEETTVAQVDAWHRERGWSGIGYHWLVHRIPGGPWTVSPGRAEAVVGAHDAGQNADSIGVAVAGNYSSRPMSSEAWWVLCATVSDVCRRYLIEASAVEGHRENEPATTPTECPGALVDLDELRTTVDLIIRGRTP